MDETAALTPGWEAVTTWVVSGITAVGIVLTALAKLAPKWKRLRGKWERKREYRSAVENARAFRALGLYMREWRAHCGAQRALTLTASNSGKPWPPDKPLYVSCIDQAVAEATRNTWARWDNWRVDPAYRNLLYGLLATMETDRGVLITTTALDNGVLRDAYEEQGTVASVIFAIEWMEGSALIYVSLNFGREIGNKRLTDEERHNYELEAQKLYESPEKIRRMVSEGRAAWKHRSAT